MAKPTPRNDTVLSADDAARDFLSRHRIAVVGVSRAGDAVGNIVYRKLRAARYQVFAVNPSAERLEGDPCYPSLATIPGSPVDGAFVATHPDVTARVVEECVDVGIERVWIHRSFGQGSVSPEAVRIGEERGLVVIAGACPMMYCAPVDLGHRCMKWLLGMTGGLPKAIGGRSATPAPGGTSTS